MITEIKKQWHRIISGILAVAMVINMLPAGALTAFAATSTDYYVLVKDQNGTPVEGASVTVTDSEDAVVTDGELTDADGKVKLFTFEDETPAAFTVKAEKDGYVSNDKAFTAEISENEATVEVVIEKVPETYTVYGTVTYPDDPDTVENEAETPVEAKVTLNGAELEITDGKFSFTGIPASADAYTLKVEPADEAYAVKEVEVTVTDKDVECDVELEKVMETYTVTGTITDEEGTAVAEAVVTLGDKEYSTTDGTFKFENVASGEYTITVAAADEKYETAEITVTVADQDTEVPVELKVKTFKVSFTSALDVTFEKEDATAIAAEETVAYGEAISFKVVKAEGVPEIEVLLKDGDAETILSATEDVYTVSDIRKDYTVEVIELDVTAPELTATVSDGDTWTKEKTVTVEVTDDSDFTLYISETEIADPTPETVATATELAVTDGKAEYLAVKEGEENTYYLYAVDEKGNIGTLTVAVKNIDITAPVVDGYEEFENRYFDWDKFELVTSYKYQVSANDALSGIAKVVFVPAVLGGKNVEVTEPNEEGYYLAEATTEKAFSIVRVYDNVGNVKEYITGAVDADATGITLNTVFQTGSNKAQITVEYRAAKEQNYEYTYTHGGTTSEKVALTYDGQVNGIYVYKASFEIEENGKYTVKVYREGRTRAMVTSSITVYSVDDDNPTVDAVKQYAKDADGNWVLLENDAWTNTDVEIRVNSSDKGTGFIANKPALGVNNVFYSVNGGETQEIFYDGSEYTAIPVSEQGESEYIISVKDYAGLHSDKVKTTVRIDKTAPELSVVSPTAPEQDVTVEFTAKDKESTVTVIVKETVENEDGTTTEVETPTEVPVENSGIKAIKYNMLNKDTGEEEKDVEIQGDNGTVDVEKDGHYTFTAVSIDNAGNESTPVTAEVVRDKTAPVIESVTANGEDVTFNASAPWYFSKEAVTVTIAASDATTSVASIVTKLTSTSLTENGSSSVTTEENGNTIQLTEDGLYQLEITVTDEAGNAVTEKTNLILIDSKVPEGADSSKPLVLLTPSGEMKKPESGIYTGDVTVTLAVIDPAAANGTYSGLNTVEYLVKAADVTDTLSEVLIYENGTKGDIRQDLTQEDTKEITVNSNTFYSNAVELSARAEDNAGNEFIPVVQTIKIDPKAPVVKVEFEAGEKHNEMYYQETVKAKITIEERNFDSKLVEFTAEKDGKDMGLDFSWDSEGDVHTANVVFDKDGKYTFAITKVTDIAGNETTDIEVTGGVPETFVVDKTDPVIRVSYDNNAVVNGHYFNNFRTATVTVTERNFDADLIKASITASLAGAGISAPGLGSWSSSGDRHTATIHYNADGDYTFEITGSDLAGRSAGEPEYGDSAAPEKFTVDTTIEAPMITGVENGVAYKGDVIPVITFTDVNYESHEISLLRTRTYQRNVDVTADLITPVTLNGQGGSSTSNNFDKIAENDGIYVLTVSMTDMAGNTEMESVTFTVNRFGSVYVYGEYLASLVADGGAYVQQVTDDLVITEYNPDRLLSDSLIIETTRDGRPVDIDYTVSPTINEYVGVGESGWFQYSYTMDKENFTSDGVYKIAVSSRDATGNFPETANYEDMDILFRVDSTPPEITSVVGLEEAIVNAEQIEVRYTVFDAIALKSVKIYIDGALKEEITDFSADMNNYEGSFIIEEGRTAQSVRIVVEDMAGNITDTGAEDFTSAYVFNDKVTVSTNMLVRLVANKPLFFGLIALLAGGFFWFFLIFKRRKDEEEEEA